MVEPYGFTIFFNSISNIFKKKINFVIIVVIF